VVSLLASKSYPGERRTLGTLMAPDMPGVAIAVMQIGEGS
jgi:hypothetical protein